MSTAYLAPLAFNAPVGPTFDSPIDAAFSVDHEARVIRGLAVPFGVTGRANGALWQFARGTLTWPAELRRIKLLIGHDFNQAVGYIFELTETPLGLMFAAKVAPGPEGDRALIMADPKEGGVWDGVSIGLGQGGQFSTRRGVNFAVTAPVIEISLTPLPSFTDARVQSVAASAAHTTEGNHHMKLTAEEKARLAALRGQATLNQDEAAELSGLAAREADETDEGSGGPDFSAIAEAIKVGFSNLQGLPAREEVNPAGGGNVQVDEQPLYRFDGLPGQRSLTSDMQDALKGDFEARTRLDEFFNETFAIDTADTAALNPDKNRPDLYVGALHFNTPLWDMVTTGSIEDNTPFTIPKFVSSSGLVAPHEEGVEPDPGTLVATSQKIIPEAISGKAEINREVLDKGGSPQADQILWNEMLAAYYEARELRIAALLATATTPEINLAGATDAALVRSLKRYFADLQFKRGGNRFSAFAADGTLFGSLVEAEDGMERPLLPVIGATNADGQVSGAFDSVAVGSQRVRAAWALGAGNAARSYNFVPGSVYAWASTPRKFEFQYQLKSIDIGIWGYGAEAITRMSDVQPIDATTAD